MDISETIQKTYRIDRRQIYFLRFILEGYDSMAIVRTLDPEQGIIVIHIAPGCEDDVKMILEDLGNEIMIKEE
ncbi:MAG: DUF4911 domain-containing protein [Deltaproteobacteria bacterium]|nr:DUF4911 domain-containing protein [Deltaproteobacteria bacterium]